MRKGWTISFLFLAMILSACGGTPSSVVGPSSAVVAKRVYVAPPAVADYKLFSDSADRFQITYPDSWLVVQTPDTTAKVIFVNPSPNGAKPDQAAAAVIVQDPVSNLETAANSADQELRAQGATNFTTQLQRTVDVNGLQGIERMASYELQGHRLTQRTVYLANQAHTYVLTLTTPNENVERYNVIFDHIISSFVAS